MIDVASTIRAILHSVCFKLSSTLTAEQRGERAVEADFYGLLDRVMPYFMQEQIGVALQKRACVTGMGFHSSTFQLNLSHVCL